MDIDETLIHGRQTPLGRDCDLRAGPFFIYLRPYVRQFLASVSEHYNLAYWSSATEDYLQIVLDALTSDLGKPLVFAWGRKRCTRRFDFELQEEYFLKDLKKVKRLGFDLNRVLILEDEPKKVNKHYGNAVYVKAFEGAIDDNELPKLASYLLSIQNSADFRSLEKRSWRIGNY